MTCSTQNSLIGSCHSVGTYLQLQGIMGNWDILLFLLQSSLYRSSFLTLLSLLLSSLCLILLISHLFFSFSLFSPSSFCFLISRPSFTPYLNYFPFPLLCVSLSCLHPSISLTSSSSPSSLASYLNCSAHRRTQSDWTPCQLYCQHQFYCKEPI